MNASLGKSFLSSVFIVFLLTTCLLVQPASAQDDQPPWMEALSCADPKYDGIVYCQASISNRNTTTSAVHVVAVNLKTPGIRFEYALPEGVNGQTGKIGVCQDVNRKEKGSVGCDQPGNPNYYPLIPFDVAANRFENTAVVVTADYGAHDGKEPASRDHGAEGLTIVQTNRLDGPLMNDGDNGAVGRPWLEISEFPDQNVRIGQLSTDGGEKPDAWAYTALGGAPWMIQNGVVTEGEITNCNAAAGSCYPRASQVAVGLTSDHSWLFLVVMERPQPNLDKSPTPLLDLAYFMRDELEVYKAIKLDGGGSTKLQYGGVNIYIDSGRALSQYLVVIAEPSSGNGGEDEDPGDQDDESTPFWARIWQSIQDFFRNLWAGITEEADRWMEERQRRFEQWWQEQLAEFQRRLQEWLATVFQQWAQSVLQQCCGSAVIPVGIVGLMLFQRRKRKH